MTIEALKLAREALSPWSGENANHTEQYAAYHAIDEVLAQPEQEPVAHVSSVQSGSPLMCGLSEWERQGLVALYTTPPQRKPLTEDEAVSAVSSVLPVTSTGGQTHHLQIQHKHALEITRAVEAAHGIKETLAQPEPVAHIPLKALELIKSPTLVLNNVPLYGYSAEGTAAVYTTPPQRTWVGLTDDEREAAMAGMDNRWDIAEAIEDELKEKNT